MILVYYANRAEKSILDPVVNQLKTQDIKHKYVDLSKHIKNIENDKNLSRIYDYVYKECDSIEDIDYAIVIGDRREIMFACLALFIKNIKIVQLASGDLSEKISLVDDYFRHLITILSSKQVCFTNQSNKNSDSLRNILNLDTDSIYLPNPTLSDLNLEKINNTSSKVNFKKSDMYDLILIHPQSLSSEDTTSDSKEIIKYFKKDKKTIIIKGNKDKNYKILYNLWENLSKNKNVSVYENLEKNSFISLLANCDRFITNSSCSFYEAPLFLDSERIVRIGKRNKNREIVNYDISEIKSASKIVKFLTGVQ